MSLGHQMTGPKCGFDPIRLLDRSGMVLIRQLTPASIGVRAIAHGRTRPEGTIPVSGLQQRPQVGRDSLPLS
ncbi:hypothetical protein BBJ41_38205 [Burkholderia stabilis]|nr:hypothetical protein BBJ41_38205 [Burkholderia stabilis]